MSICMKTQSPLTSLAAVDKESYDVVFMLQMPPYAELSVWSAQHPLKLPVSAVLVKINFRTGQQCDAPPNFSSELY